MKWTLEGAYGSSYGSEEEGRRLKYSLGTSVMTPSLEGLEGADSLCDCGGRSGGGRQW